MLWKKKNLKIPPYLKQWWNLINHCRSFDLHQFRQTRFIKISKMPIIKISIVVLLTLRNWASCCSESTATFYLFKNDHLNYADIITAADLNSTSFDFDLPTKIIIHGWLSNMNEYPLAEMRKQYLERTTRPANVISVDWSELAKGGNENVSNIFQELDSYLQTLDSVNLVSECIAGLIEKIFEGSSNEIHVIGFSIGAHVAGIAANYLPDRKMHRITGLDPASPGFMTSDLKDKLDAGDADFVDVYHTNVMLKGLLSPHGHVDFYFNLGISQPGCDYWDTRCNHFRSAQYFAESINSEDGFWGHEGWMCLLGNLLGNFEFCKGNNVALSGDLVDSNDRGVFFVKTKDASPYALGLS